MQLKPLVAAALLAAAASGSHAANVTVTLGNDGTLGFGAGSITGATFTDTWNLALGSFVPPASGKLKFESSLTSFDGITFTSVTLNGIAFDLTSPVPKLSVAYGSGSSAQAFPWVLSVSGTTDGLGSYGGQLSVSAVPEPETYALMLAGLGALGFIARRRSQR